jgi:hypothetical protein
MGSEHLLSVYFTNKEIGPKTSPQSHDLFCLTSVPKWGLPPVNAVSGTQSEVFGQVCWVLFFSGVQGKDVGVVRPPRSHSFYFHLPSL